MTTACLNPFYFRAGLLPMVWMYTALRMPVLIPFISGLDCYKGRGKGFRWVLGLNPFYFRAGLLQSKDDGQSGESVLIPFISGLDCYLSARRRLPRRPVLIPFISGLDCYGALLMALQNTLVLIPFISGLDCYGNFRSLAACRRRS